MLNSNLLRKLDMQDLILFILGTFMDMASTILICTPLFLPLAIHMGMGPVQFGICPRRCSSASPP